MDDNVAGFQLEGSRIARLKDGRLEDGRLEVKDGDFKYIEDNFTDFELESYSVVAPNVVLGVGNRGSVIVKPPKPTEDEEVPKPRKRKKKDFFNKVGEFVENIVPRVLPGPTIAKDILDGKDPVDAIAGNITAPSVAAQQIENKVQEEIAKLAKQGGGEEAEKFINDLRRVLRPLNATDRATLQNHLIRALREGNMHLLDPIVVQVASEIQKSRDTYWDQAEAIPPEVIAGMPPEIVQYAKASRFIGISKVQSLSLPSIAVEQLKKASAIVTIDLIFFLEVPGFTSARDKHLWTHELLHLKQYANMGLPKFVALYTGEEIGFSTQDNNVNPLEREADLFACRHFRVPGPTYIGTCP